MTWPVEAAQVLSNKQIVNTTIGIGLVFVLVLIGLLRECTCHSTLLHNGTVNVVVNKITVFYCIPSPSIGHRDLSETLVLHEMWCTVK